MRKSVYLIAVLVTVVVTGLPASEAGEVETCSGHGISKLHGMEAGLPLKATVTIDGTPIGRGRPTWLKFRTPRNVLTFRVTAGDPDTDVCAPTVPVPAYVEAKTKVAVDIYVQEGTQTVHLLNLELPLDPRSPRTAPVWTRTWELPERATPSGGGAEIDLLGKEVFFRFAGTIDDVECDAPRHQQADDKPPVDLRPHIAEVTVAGVRITDPGENEVYLHAASVTFRTEVLPASAPFHGWSWSILEGVGSPTSSQTDTYDPVVRNADRSYATPDVFKAKVRVFVDSIECVAERAIRVVYPRISRIDFTGWEMQIVQEGTWRDWDPEWTVGMPADRRSVSGFTRGNRISLKARFETALLLSRGGSINRLYADAGTWVHGDPDCESDPPSWPVSGTSTDIDLVSLEPLPNHVFAYDATSPRRRIGYRWFYEMPGTGDERHVIEPVPSENVHHIYVTLGTPTPAFPGFMWTNETLLYITCRAANGRTTEADSVKRIWKEFTDLDVRRRDRTQMVYWGPASSVEHPPDWVFETWGVVRHADARCDGWAQMLNDCFRTHGITSGIVSAIRPLDKPTEHLDADEILVKRYNMRPDPPTDLPGIKAQGNANPRSNFPGHRVVRYGGLIYDPSYGKLWRTLNNWEDGSLDGFRYIQTVPPYDTRYRSNTKRVLETEITP